MSKEEIEQSIETVAFAAYTHGAYGVGFSKWYADSLHKAAISKSLSDFADQQVREDRESRWISVEKELPESGKLVFCNGKNGKHFFVGLYTKGKDVEVAPDDDYDIDAEDDSLEHGWLKPGWYEEEETPNCSYDFSYVSRNVTHWQPLPSPPKI